MFDEMKKKIILFGGTFDPIHVGHISVAEHAAEQISAQKVIFIPASRSPHKNMLPVASVEHRLEMVRLAIAEQNKFCVSDCELKRPQPSYTLDTVIDFRAKYDADTRIYVLIGADMLHDLDKWYCICDLIDACNLSVMLRGGAEEPDFDRFEKTLGHQRVEKLKADMISTPLIDISSSEIRQKLAEGADVNDMLDADVLAYIRKNRLYSL